MPDGFSISTPNLRVYKNIKKMRLGFLSCPSVQEFVVKTMYFEFNMHIQFSSLVTTQLIINLDKQGGYYVERHYWHYKRKIG